MKPKLLDQKSDRGADPLFRCSGCLRFFERDADCDDGMVIPGHPMQVLIEPQPPKDAIPGLTYKLIKCDLDDCDAVQSKGAKS